MTMLQPTFCCAPSCLARRQPTIYYTELYLAILQPTLQGPTEKLTKQKTAASSLENELLLFYSKGDEASDRVTNKAASSIEKKRQNKTTDTAASAALVKANKRPIEQATKRLDLLRENQLLLASDGDEGTDRETGK
jgi:hypothetical protein